MSTAKALQAYLEQPHSFDWAGHHCCAFAAGWVKSRTGFDAMAGLPKIESKTSVLRLIDSMGGLVATIAHQIGEPIPPALAQVGDLALIGDSLGICNGRTAACIGEDGSTVHLSMLGATAAWRVAP